MGLTADFITDVRRQARLTAQTTDADILRAGDMEVRVRFLPMLRQAGSEYGLRRLLLPIANGRVRIPDRAQVAGVRLVQWVAPGGALQVLPQVQPEDDPGPVAGVSTPLGWYFDAGDLCVLPSSASGSVWVRYYQRASAMVASNTATVAQLTTVSVGATSMTLAWGGGSVFSGGDVVSGAADHRVVLPGLVTGASPAVVSLSALADRDYDLPSTAASAGRTLGVGDWVTPAGQTPFTPLPEELDAALVHRTAGVMLHSLGYLEEANSQLSLADEATARAMALLTPRSDGTPLVWTAGLSRSLGMRRW